MLKVNLTMLCMIVSMIQASEINDIGSDKDSVTAVASSSPRFYCAVCQEDCVCESPVFPTKESLFDKVIHALSAVLPGKTVHAFSSSEVHISTEKNDV